MANEAIDPIRLSQLADPAAAPFEGVLAPSTKPLTGNLFEDTLHKAVGALEGVSAMELKTDALIQGFMDGKVDLVDAVTAASELNIVIQLTMTVANQAIQAFQELTRLQV